MTSRFSMKFSCLPLLWMASLADANTITVAPGGNLQAALNSAKAGDVIQISAGATFTGHFTLPSNPGPGWITIQSTAMGSLPPAGTRVNPSMANPCPSSSRRTPFRP
jgi:hypothetical protein